jgi:hypothetical protein
MQNSQIKDLLLFYGRPYLEKSFNEIIIAVSGSQLFDAKPPEERENLIVLIVKIKERIIQT